MASIFTVFSRLHAFDSEDFHPTTLKDMIAIREKKVHRNLVFQASAAVDRDGAMRKIGRSHTAGLIDVLPEAFVMDVHLAESA